MGSYCSWILTLKRVVSLLFAFEGSIPVKYPLMMGKNVRIMRSILMDGVRVGDNAKLENCIVGTQAEIGDRAQLKETDVGPYYVVPRGAESKNEKLVAYDDDADDDDADASSSTASAADVDAP